MESYSGFRKYAYLKIEFIGRVDEAVKASIEANGIAKSAVIWIL